MPEPVLPSHRDLPPQRLRRFAVALRELSNVRDVDETLQLSVDLAIELVDGVDLADIMFARSHGVVTPVVTEELARTVDNAQLETGEGPCLSALATQEMVVVDDLVSDGRWPDFASRAVQLGIRSVAAYPLYVGRADQPRPIRLGSLNLYGRDSGLTELAIELGGVFAAHCSAVIHAEMGQTGLRDALETRDLIGQAKGVLMGRHGVTAEAAYEMLREASNVLNIKLHTLAGRVAYIGDLPDS